MHLSTSKKHRLLNGDEFNENLFSMGYDRRFAAAVFTTLINRAAPRLNPTEKVERVFKKIEFSFRKPTDADSEHSTGWYSTTYSTDYDQVIRTSESISYHESNRDGVEEDLLSLPNLATVADKLHTVNQMGSKRIEATLALIALYQSEPVFTDYSI